MIHHPPFVYQYLPRKPREFVGHGPGWAKRAVLIDFGRLHRFFYPEFAHSLREEKRIVELKDEKEVEAREKHWLKAHMAEMMRIPG